MTLYNKNSEIVNSAYEMNIGDVDDIAEAISGHGEGYHYVLEEMAFEDEEMGIGA
jgi:hypothetical protein